MIESGGASSGRASSGASTRGGESTRDLAGEAPAAIGEAPPPNAREPSAATPAASERAPWAMPAATTLGVSLAGLLATFCCLAAGVDGSPGLRAAPPGSLRVAPPSHLGRRIADDGHLGQPEQAFPAGCCTPTACCFASGVVEEEGLDGSMEDLPHQGRLRLGERCNSIQKAVCSPPLQTITCNHKRRSGERWSNARGLWARPDRPVGSASGSRSSAASTCGRICPAGRAPARPLPTAPMVPADWASEIR